MPETIILTYRLTEDLWRLFFEAHYGCDRALKIRYLWGMLCTVIGAAGISGLYDSPVVAVLLLCTGLFAVLSKPLLVIKSLRKARRHPFLGKELTVSVSPAELSVRSGTSGYTLPWHDFVGYRHLTPGFLLYHDEQAFFFIPEAVLTAGSANRIIQILDQAEVPRL
jgi:hypothetical protein